MNLKKYLNKKGYKLLDLRYCLIGLDMGIYAYIKNEYYYKIYTIFGLPGIIYIINNKKSMEHFKIKVN